MRRLSAALVLPLLFTVAFLASCGSDSSTGPGTPPEPQPVYDLDTVMGRFEPPGGFAAPVTDFAVHSIAATDSVAADSSFTLSVPVDDGLQVLFFTPLAGGDPAFLGLLDPGTRGVSADIDACAQALTLANPQLIFATPQDKRDYLEKVSLTGAYASLRSALEGLYAADPATALDYHLHPQVYQLSAEAMQEGVDSLVAAGRGRVSLGPYVDDLPGPDVAVVNPSQIFYGLNFQEEGGSAQVQTVAPATPMGVDTWGWPPDYVALPDSTPMTLGEGSFEFYFARGLDYALFDDWSDATGRATVLNTGYGLMKLAELFLGTTPYTDPADFEGVASHFTLNQNEITRLQVAAANRDVLGFMTELCALMQSHRNELDEWFWGLEAPDTVADYLRWTGGQLADQIQVFQILGLGVGRLPLFYDLLQTTGQISYSVSQDANGVLTVDASNLPPAADFDVSPEAGTVGTEFTLDASNSADDNDTPSQLVFRWDFESDGSFDTEWSAANFYVLHSYGTAGAYQITLQVRDSAGLIGEKVQGLSVGGGAGTASHVLLFKNVDPWGTSAMITTLTGLGFTEGQGEGTYEVLSSADMATAQLEPGADLVIFQNDQDQTFYDAYTANTVKFTSFIYQGGAVLWEACDNGWNGGDLTDAGVLLPGAVQPAGGYSDYNYVPNPQLPLVAGLPTTMQGNFASHRGFSNLPPSTTVYTIDTTDLPTLVEFHLGEGWVIMTGQPLEFHTDNGTVGLSELLSRILSYFTGVSTSPRAALPARGAPLGGSSAQRP